MWLKYLKQNMYFIHNSEEQRRLLNAFFTELHMFVTLVKALPHHPPSPTRAYTSASGRLQPLKVRERGVAVSSVYYLYGTHIFRYLRCMI